MTIEISSMWHIVGLVVSLCSIIFYAARSFGKTVEQIERLSKAIDTIQQNLETQHETCRTGRVDIWTEVNKIRERLTAVETLQKIKEK